MKNGKYILVVAPDDYPGRKYRGKYCYEHHLIWWKTYGFIPSDGECLHHINGNPHDNRIENLQLKTRKEHSREHAKRVEPIECICEYCGRRYFISPREYRFKKKKGERFFCSRKCVGRATGGLRKPYK